MGSMHRAAAAGLAAASILSGAIGSADAQPAAPPTADAVRGGWTAEVDGTRHIFVLKVRDGAVSGIYCDVDCSEPSHLAFVERGTLTADGARFDVVKIDGGAEMRTSIVGRLSDGGLVLTWDRLGKRGGGPNELRLERDPRKPAPVTVEELFARRGITSGPLVISGSTAPYEPPAPNETLTAAALEGLWVWSTGPAKQHFIFREVGGRILGVVCGPCDNPYTFGALDNGVIRGDTFTFDINHEDWGIGIEFGPYANHATATLSHHELHLRTVQQNGPRTIEGDLVLIGPIRTAR